VRVHEHTIEVGGTPVFYRSAARPSSLFLHGVPTSSDDWTAFLDRIDGIAPDLIGFGRTGKGGHLDYTIDGHAGFIEAFLDRLGVERVALVAHQWGAAGGLVFAQRNPERIERLVLIDALPLLEGFTWPRIPRIWRAPLLGELAMGAVTRSMFKRTMRKGGSWPDEELDALWQQFDQGTQRAILRLHRDASEQRLAGAGAELDTLRSPALVLHGEDDPWLAPMLGDRYAASLPDASLERIPNAGHWPWLDQPSVIERVAEFLSEPP